jgi:hypothetical protein
MTFYYHSSDILQAESLIDGKKYIKINLKMKKRRAFFLTPNFWKVEVEVEVEH